MTQTKIRSFWRCPKHGSVPDDVAGCPSCREQAAAFQSRFNEDQNLVRCIAMAAAAQRVVDLWLDADTPRRKMRSLMFDLRRAYNDWYSFEHDKELARMEMVKESEG